MCAKKLCCVFELFYFQHDGLRISVTRDPTSAPCVALGCDRLSIREVVRGNGHMSGDDLTTGGSRTIAPAVCCAASE